MSEFKTENYFPIYVRCIRPDQPLPFDCFILLRQSNRIVLWVRNGEILPKEKIDKLHGHSIDKIFIRVEDKPAYFIYLDGYLGSKDGEASLKEIKESAAPIEGVPINTEFALQALKVSGAHAADEAKIEVKGGGEVTPPPPPEIGGAFGDVIRTIKNEVSEFERTAVNGLIKELSHRKIIEDCTLKISDELIRVEDKLKSQGTVDKDVVAEIKKQFHEQIMVISGRIEQDGASTIRQRADAILKQISDLEAQGRDKKVNPKSIRKKVRRIKNSLAALAKLAKEDPHTVISQTITRIIGNVEQKLGQRLTLDPEVGMYEDLPDYMRERLDMDDIMMATGEDVKRFQHEIIRQNMLIQDLDRRYKTNCQELKALYDKWYLFQVQAKKSLSGADVVLAKEIDKGFQKFEGDFGGLQTNANALLSVAQKITLDMGGKHLSIDAELLAELNDDLNAEQNADQNGETVAAEQTSQGVSSLGGGDGAGGVGSAVGSTTAGNGLGGDTARLLSENEVLKTQLENAQKLVDACGFKIDELEQLIEKNNALTEKLEDQNKEYSKLNTGLEEKVEKFQTAEDAYNDTLTGVDNEAKLSLSQVETQKDRISDLEVETELNAKELKALKENLPLDEVLKAKDEHLLRVKDSLTQKSDEVQAMKKEVVTLTAKLYESQQKYKHISHKTDRMSGEIEALKKAVRSSQAKAEGALNSLKQSRKTISKLTEISDQLRKDRQTYISKTNETMAKFETMMSEASNLNRQVENEAKVKTELEAKLKSAQAAEKKLRTEVRHLTSEVANLQALAETPKKKSG